MEMNWKQKILIILTAILLTVFSVYKFVRSEKKEGINIPVFYLFNKISVSNASNPNVLNLLRDLSAGKINSIESLWSSLGLWGGKPASKIPYEVMVSNHQMAAYTFFAPINQSTPIHIKTRYLGKYVPTVKIYNNKDLITLNSSDFKQRNVLQSDDRNVWSFNFTCKNQGVWYMQILFKEGNVSGTKDPIDYNDYGINSYVINCESNVDTNAASLPDLLISKITLTGREPGVISGDRVFTKNSLDCMDAYGNFYETPEDLKRVNNLIPGPQERKSCQNNPALLNNYVSFYDVCILNKGTFPAANVNLKMDHSKYGYYLNHGLIAYNGSNPEECACETDQKKGSCCGPAIMIDENAFGKNVINTCNKEFCGSFSQLHARNNYCQTARYISFYKGAYDTIAEGLRSSGYYGSFRSEIERYLSGMRSKIENLLIWFGPSFVSGRYDSIAGTLKMEKPFDSAPNTESNINRINYYLEELAMDVSKYVSDGKIVYNPSVQSIIGGGQGGSLDVQVTPIDGLDGINYGDKNETPTGNGPFWERKIKIINPGETKCMQIALYARPLQISRKNSSYTFDVGATAFIVDPFGVNKEANELNNSDLASISSNCQGQGNDAMNYCTFEYYNVPLLMGKQYLLTTNIGSAKTSYIDLRLPDRCQGKNYTINGTAHLDCEAKMPIIVGKWFLPGGGVGGVNGTPYIPDCLNGVARAGGGLGLSNSTSCSSVLENILNGGEYTKGPDDFATDIEKKNEEAMQNR